MRRNNLVRGLALFTLIALLPCLASAGGPLIVNPDTKTAYTYGPGTVQVYYDNGDLASNIWDWNQDPAVQVTLGNSVGRHLVEKGYADWSAIPTTSLRAAVHGRFASIG